MSNKIRAVVTGFALLFLAVGVAGCNFKNKQGSNPENTPGTEKSREEMKGKNPPNGENRPGGPQMNLSEEAQTAMENKDYNAWLAAVSKDSPLKQIITSEEKFLKYLEMEEAIKSGDQEKAQEIREELGFPERPEG